MAVKGLVLSIIGLVFSWFWWLGGVLGVIALPLAIMGLKYSAKAGKEAKANGQKSGIATAGLVVGIIATVFAGLFFGCSLCIVNSFASCFNGIETEFTI